MLPGVDCLISTARLVMVPAGSRVFFHHCVFPRVSRSFSSRHGENSSSFDFRVIPSVLAPHARARNSTAARCEPLRPPSRERLPRMEVMWIGTLVREDSDRANRMSWPPPSRVVPSMWMGSGEDAVSSAIVCGR